MGERSWKVTPRGDQPADVPAFDPAAAPPAVDPVLDAAVAPTSADPPVADVTQELPRAPQRMAASPGGDVTQELPRTPRRMAASPGGDVTQELPRVPRRIAASPGGDVTRELPRTPQRVGERVVASDVTQELPRRSQADRDGSRPVASSAGSESERIHGSVAGLVGEPLLPRRVPGHVVRTAFRHDEQLLARRARTLVDRPVPGEPLVGPVADRSNFAHS